MNVSSRARFHFLATLLFVVSCFALISPAGAQNRFTLRAEPDVIAANGISTTSIFVQVPSGRSAIQSSPMVHFATTAGVIESQAQLSGGVARVLLRSSTTPGTAIVTAFIGSSREAITVEFSEDNGLARRYLEVSAPYVAYGANSSQITASGKTGLDFGDTHIESDVRLDVDLVTERIWAQGTKGSVVIRHGRGNKVKELRGDRLFYDLRRNRGVMRRAESTGKDQQARQEFVGSDFAPPPVATETVPDAPTKAAESQPATESEVKPPLSPSPTKALENEEDRGSTFVVPAPPPTAATSDKGTDSAAVVPPAVLDSAKETPAEATTDPKLEETAPEAADAPASQDETAPVADMPLTTQFGYLTAQLNASRQAGASTVAPGSLADTPKAPEGSEARVTALVTSPRPKSDDTELKTGAPPAYSPLPADSGSAPGIVELPPPTLDTTRGYWVASRRLRVFPRDKVQFEKASIYFNGAKAFGVPLYVLPLDGSFNPTTDMFSFNSQGGVSLKFPFYYQATKSNTGALYLKRDPGSGFSTERSGFSLAMDHQYWLSPRSHGKFSMDQIGHGAWNLNYQHEMQLSSDTTGSFYLNMPRHRDMFARASLAKELKSMQIGFEAFYDAPETTSNNVRGQFFARSRPKAVGKSGWTYTMGANALAVKRGYSETITVGGGGIPGEDSGSHVFTRSHPLIGQTLTASLQSPNYSPWRGSGFTANLLATAFNYSNGRRGAAPGITMGFGQNLGKVDLRLDYTYDRSNLGLYGLTSESFTHYVSGSLSAQLGSKIGLSTFMSKSLQDGSLYGSADLDYHFSDKWRAGLFTDYSNFTDVDSLFNYGMSIGRMVGPREISVNYDAVRGKVYLELGNSRY